MVGLGAACLITLADHAYLLAGWGNWLKQRHAADVVIVLIFIFSGLALTPEQLKKGLTDVKGVLLTLVVIFIMAPVMAALFGLLPLQTGILIGLFLVAVMPSTLSSGVVMTAESGGNAAHALVTTITANSLAAFTIPFTLSFLLQIIGASASITIDKAAMMLKIFLLVVVPLMGGLALKAIWPGLYERVGAQLNKVNQGLIILIVWIALSQTRDILLNSGLTVVLIIVISFIFHGLLLLCGWSVIRISARPKGAYESILFMGGQKTLSLSVILQVSLFPQYGIALPVCVIHHIVHLVMDGYLVARLKSKDQK